MTSLTSTTYTNYDPMGRVGTVIDPNKITTYTYDTRGRITQMDEGGAVSTYRYNLNGTLESTTTPLGETIQYTYDNAQRLIEIIDHEGNRIVYTLNTEGNREQEDIYDSTTLVKTLSRTFDSHNLLESVIEPHGTTTFSYDLNKNLIQVIDAGGNITTHNYDALNRLISVISPSPDGVSPSPQTSYEYDIQDNLIKIIDPNGLITNYLYDDLSNLLQITSPDTGITTNTHDPAGNLLTKTDSSETTTYCYDAQNRLTEVHFADSTRDIYYTYDHGRLTGIIDSNVTYAYTYDPLGNIIKQDKTIDGNTYTTQYAYQYHNLKSITYPNGLMVNYHLDETGKVVKITSGETTLVSDIEYLPFGPVKSITHANGIVVNKTYDLSYRITSINDIQDKTYILDSINNITAIANNLDPSRNKSFSYDNLGRLTHAQGFYGTIDYTYDAAGNRLTRTNGVEETYQYTPGTNQLSEITGFSSLSFSYDGNCNAPTMG